LNLIDHLITLFDIKNVVTSNFIIFSQDLGFHSPEVYNYFFNFVSYSRFNSIYINFNQFDIKCNLKTYHEKFMVSRFTKSDLDDYSNKLNKFLKQISRFDEIFIKSANYTKNKSQWNIIYKDVQEVVKEIQNEIIKLYLVDREMLDSLKQLVNVDQYKYDLTKISPSIQLKIMLNYNEIKEMIRNISYLENSSIDRNFVVNVMMLDVLLPPAIFDRFTHILHNYDRDEMLSLLNLLDQIKETQFYSRFVNNKDLMYLKILMNPQSTQILIDSLINLTDQQLIDHRDVIKNIARHLKLDNVVSTMYKIYNYKLKGYLDHNYQIRPINIFQFKDVDKYDALKLTDEQLNILSSYLDKKDDGLVNNGEYNVSTNITYIKSNVFTINLIPNIIFKIIKDDYYETRILNHIYAQEVVRYYDLNLLIVPKMGFIRKYRIIFEEMLDIEISHYKQEYLYRIHADKMGSAIRQLTKFCCLTGLDDIAWRNIPIINNVAQTLMIGLVDMQEMESYHNSIFGGAYNRTGLIRCVDRSLFHIIADELLTTTGNPCEESMESVIEIREKEIKFDDMVYSHYEKHQITGFEHIHLDVNKLCFDEYTDEDKEKLIKLSTELVDSLNMYLDLHCEKGSLKQNRQITINKDRDSNFRNSVFDNVNFLWKIYKKSDLTPINNRDCVVTHEEQTYLNVALKELERIGTIIKLVRYYGSDPIVQI